ncbi:MAG TPA: SCP2 sterol-binding domain-containing protein [Planctomycetota bacterium]
MPRVHAEQVRAICLEEGAAGAGFVEAGRAALGEEREAHRIVFPAVRSLVSLMVRLNPENMQAPPRHFANDETQQGVKHLQVVARRILARLNALGVRGVVAPVSFPMDMHRWPGKLWDVSHKPIAVEAGLGHMGIHRSVIHPEFGSFVLLETLLIDAEFDAYGQPLGAAPCMECLLCVSACPVGAISAAGPFDSSACLTHNYREFLGGFQDWVETLVESPGPRDYRERVSDQETLSWWQSLAHGPSYKSSYCIAVCPAGEELKGPWLLDRAAYVEKTVRPLRERAEPVYVVAGTPAEAAAARHPNKTVRRVRNPVRLRSVSGYLEGLRRVPEQRLARLAFRIDLEFTGAESLRAALEVRDGALRVGEFGAGAADGVLRADARTFVDLLNGETRLWRARLARRLRYRGDRAALFALFALR